MDRVCVDPPLDWLGVARALVAIPRVGFTFEAIFSPFGSTSVHPFTGVSAADAGRDTDEPRCVILCAPELKIEPTWTIENLGGPRRVEVDLNVWLRTFTLPTVRAICGI